ncbi:hypothetical protein CDD82_1655 [Ophiocordyceps australis]|uniref:Uncharacterized protein n=1 Tax=Ophiocordyceps australis TaxID=1399860 RepID=A0A2C5YDR3_9HYPO|nr:hypothetical protein CDD82_1655 [Ophiocordyceps australis]
MCGPETTTRPRGGALVALGPPSPARDAPETHQTGSRVYGDLIFHTPGKPESSQATHARLTPDTRVHQDAFNDLEVVIHASGDLTRSAVCCGLLRRFSLPALHRQGFVELLLDEPLSLTVGDGDAGIIGRRVSLRSRGVVGDDGLVVAEGIVGFNFSSDAYARSCL